MTPIEMLRLASPDQVRSMETHMPQVVNMLDAKTSLSRLVHDLETGEAKEFIIARNGRPAARLVPLHAMKGSRESRFGIAKGRFEVPDDIDKSAAEVARLFEAG